MITVEQLRSKAAALYRPVLRKLILNEDPFPVPVRYRRLQLTAPMHELRDAIAVIRSQSKEILGHGYTVRWRQVDTRRYGSNEVPGDLSFASAEDLCRYLNCETEFRTILANAGRLVRNYPHAREWAASNLRLLEKPAEYWDHLLKAVQFLGENPFPNVFARELPIEIPTKFIESNGAAIESLLRVVAPESLRAEGTNPEERLGLRTPTSLVELRLLDKTAAGNLPFTHFLAMPEELSAHFFAGFDRVVILENRIPFLTLPPTPRGMALFGQGYALHRLHRLSWLGEKQLFYWGDLDVEGFEALAGLRALFPHVAPLFMDRATFDQFESFATRGSGKQCVADHCRAHLTPAEQVLADFLGGENLRLEQEKLPHPAIKKWLAGRPSFAQ